MPVALATTKRKFHRLLDSISNASSTSLSNSNHDRNNYTSTTTLPTTVDRPVKRTRLERPRSTYIPPSKSTAAPTRPLSQQIVSKRARSNPNNARQEPREPPYFAPWDRAQFLLRLKTYRHIDKWMSKPDEINEVEWAKRGWSCVEKERVRCVGGCEKELVITLEGDARRKPDGKGEEEGKEEKEESEDDEEEWRAEAQNVLVEKYREMIACAHEGSYTIHRLPIIHRKDAVEGLRQRYASLVKMASHLPPSLFTPEDLDISKLCDLAVPILHPRTTKPSPTQLVEATVSPSAAPSDPPQALNTSALILSLFGWQAEESGHVPGLATCNACFRRLGLWLFTFGSAESSSSMERLDVVGEHREYCPWVNVFSQNGGGRRTSLDGMTGWEVMVRALRTSAGRMRGEDHELGKGEKVQESGRSMEGVDGVSEDARSEASSIRSVVTVEDERKKKDEERWARLKRLKQVFGVRRKDGGKKIVESIG